MARASALASIIMLLLFLDIRTTLAYTILPETASDVLLPSKEVAKPSTDKVWCVVLLYGMGWYVML